MAFDANDLSPHEHFVVERARLGEIADFSPMIGADEVRPSVRAGVLRRVLLQVESEWRLRAPGLRIKGARIAGVLDLTDCSGHALPALTLDACELPDGADLRRAHLARLALTQCRVARLDLDDARIDGDVDASGASPIGGPGAETFELCARAARIGGALKLTGARLARGGEASALMLDGAQIGGDIVLDRCEAFGGMRMERARIGGALTCAGASLLNRSDDAQGAALAARGAAIGADVRLNDKFKAEGEVDFSDTRIGGRVDLANSSFRNEFGAALKLASARVDGGVSGAVKLAGQMIASNAEIGGALDLRGAEIAFALTPRADAFGCAIDATGATIGADVLLQGANVKGEIALERARIGGALNLGGGRFINGGGWAVRATGARIGGDVLLRIGADGFAPFGQKSVIEGGANFDAAHIDGDLAWRQLELRGPGIDAKGGVLSFAGARIAGALDAAALTTHQDARIDARGSHCALLRDDLKTGWGAESATLALDGFQYEAMASGERWRARLTWLKRMEHPAPQPFTQLARAYAQAGKREDARRIALAGRDTRAGRGSAGPLAWIASSAFGAIAGYGLAPLRMLRALALFVALGVAGVLTMNAQGALVTPQGRACNSAVEPALYALDVALPLIDLGQESRCAPGRTARADLPQGVAVGEGDWRLFEGVALWRWAHALYALFGAILAALAVLTFAGLLRRSAR